jgi:hypothetical protein
VAAWAHGQRDGSSGIGTEVVMWVVRGGGMGVRKWAVCGRHARGGGWCMNGPMAHAGLQARAVEERECGSMQEKRCDGGGMGRGARRIGSGTASRIKGREERRKGGRGEGGGRHAQLAAWHGSSVTWSMGG